MQPRPSQRERSGRSILGCGSMVVTSCDGVGVAVESDGMHLTSHLSRVQRSFSSAPVRYPGLLSAFVDA